MCVGPALAPASSAAASPEPPTHPQCLPLPLPGPPLAPTLPPTQRGTALQPRSRRVRPLTLPSHPTVVPFTHPLQTFLQTFLQTRSTHRCLCLMRAPAKAPVRGRGGEGQHATLEPPAAASPLRSNSKFKRGGRGLSPGSPRCCMLISNRLAGCALVDLSKQQNLNYQSSSLADKIWIKEPSL